MIDERFWRLSWRVERTADIVADVIGMVGCEGEFERVSDLIDIAISSAVRNGSGLGVLTGCRLRDKNVTQLHIYDYGTNCSS